jgi:hypothetical protein
VQRRMTRVAFRRVAGHCATIGGVAHEPRAPRRARGRPSICPSDAIDGAAPALNGLSKIRCCGRSRKLSQHVGGSGRTSLIANPIFEK